MRIFLGFLVFDMVFHSFAALAPVDDPEDGWCKELGVRRFPERLPTPQERSKLAEKSSDDNPDPVGDRVWESVDSLWDYFKPWPSAETRHKLTGWYDRRRYAVCWLKTRLTFLNNLVRFNQHWSMFSPNVRKSDPTLRVELVFKDSRTEIVSNIAFPEDLTRYPNLRFLSEKVLQYQTKMVDEDEECLLGYSNLMAHRRPHNDHGSPLKTISFYLNRVSYPAPGEDAMEILRAQSGPEFWKDIEPFWQYDVETREGRKPKK